MEQTKLSKCRDQQRLPIEVRAELGLASVELQCKEPGLEWDCGIFPAVVPKPPPCLQEDRTHYHHLLVKRSWRLTSPVPRARPHPSWSSLHDSPEHWDPSMQTPNVFKPQNNIAPSCPHGVCCWWATSLSYQRLWRTVPQSHATVTVGDSSVKEVGKQG